MTGGATWGEADKGVFEAQDGDLCLLPEMVAILARLAAEDADAGDPTLMTPEEGRAQAERANVRWNREMPALFSETAFEVAGSAGSAIACRLMTPSADADGLIVFVHGGGWAFCSMATHEHAARVLAIAANAHVLTFDYRLAPEHPYPAGLDDCAAIWNAVLEGQGALAGITGPRALAGDSAGANLALALMLRQIAEGDVLPDTGLLFYGVYDDDFQSRSYIDCAEGPGLTRAKMMRYWDFYTPDKSLRKSPFISPLKANDAALLKLPPLYLNAAAIDPLRSDTARLAGRLSALGRRDQYTLYPGVVHGFMQMNPVLAEARTAAEEAASAFLEVAGKMKTT
ncbi:alpha/beta hydrolase [Martelella mediterranea]|uniref:Acetyl esterase n=1 Tax=Martelella mediterranea TaxID=293089 RepID=A0A4R3NNG1_9HYPH|nr:alpha/beta hydrolase [Martelella mediterranea]TCT31711.1 acetyl esterase [Martelella mediterranea]